MHWLGASHQVTLARGREISFSLWMAVSGSGLGWHGMGARASPFHQPCLGVLTSCPWSPCLRGAGNDPREKHLFLPRAVSVPTTAQDVSRSASPHDSTRSTEGRQQASKEAAVVQVGVSLNATDFHQVGTFSSPDLKMKAMGNLSKLRSGLAHNLGSSLWALKPV